MSVENLLKTNGYWRIAASFLLCVFLLGSAAAVPLREYGDLFNDQRREPLDSPDSLFVLDHVPLEVVARHLADSPEFRPEIFARNSRNAVAHSDNAVAIRNIGDLPMFRFGRR